MKLSKGQEKIQMLREGGFSEDEINSWREKTSAQLSDGGFSEDEIKKYFGGTDFDPTFIKENIKGNFEKQKEEINPSKFEGLNEVDTLMEAVAHGLGTSVPGLIIKGEKPGTQITPNTSLPLTTASSLTTAVADFFPSVAGAVSGTMGGAAVGSLAGPLGTVAGATVGGLAGAGALPEFIRSSLMHYYDSRTVEDFPGFWASAKDVIADTAKAGLLNVVGAGAGKVAGVVAAPLAKSVAGKVAQETIKIASESTAMETLGAELDGRAPTLNGIIQMGAVIGGAKAAGVASKQIRRIYSETGILPEETAALAKEDPVFKQQLFGDTKEAYGPPEPPKPIQVKPDDGATALVVEKTPGVDAITVKEDGSTAVDIDQARANLRAKIGAVEAPKEKGPSAIAKLKENFNEAYRLVVDKFDPVKRVVDLIEEKTGKIRADLNPHKLLRLLDGSNSLVYKFMNEGVVRYSDWGVEQGTKSFKSIVESVKGKELRFRDFLVASRVVELSTRQDKAKNIKTQFNLDEAKAIVDADSAEFKQAASDFYALQDSVLKYVKDAGILSEDAFIQISEDHKNYVSFKNVFDATEGGKAGSATGSLKKIRGSKNNIQDPFISFVENTEALVRLAETNRAKTAFVNLVSKIPGQTLLKEVSGKDIKAIDIKNELANVLEQHGVENASPESFKIFRASHKDLAENQFETYVDGKKIRYEIDPTLAKALNGVNADEGASRFIAKYLSSLQTATKWKKTFISWMPNFQVSNAIRDFTMGGMFSEGMSDPRKYKETFVYNLAETYADFFKDPKGFIKWLDGGGATGSFVDVERVVLKDKIFNLDKETGYLGKVKNQIKDNAEWMAVIARLPQVIEAAPRLAERKIVSKKFAKGGLESKVESQFAAREVTLDFSRKGAAMTAYNSITAYLNVGVQGLDRIMRAANKNPTEFALRGFAAITVPRLALWYAQKDDKRFQRIPPWEKYVFMHVLTDDWRPVTNDDLMDSANEDNKHLFKTENGVNYKNHGVIWRVPMPQGLGIAFGAIPEMLMQKYTSENPEAGVGLDEALKNLFIPSLVPDLPLPIIEHRINEKLFFGGPVIPAHLESVYGDLQFTNYTSESAKAIGRLIGEIANVRGTELEDLSSPILIDHYIKSWGGPVGDYALKLADQALIKSGVIPDPNRPASGIEDIPFVKQFISRQASGALKPNVLFEEKVRGIKKAEKSFKHLEALGDEKALDMAFKDKDFMRDAFFNLREVELARNNLRNTIDSNYRDPEMGQDEKRQLIEGMYAELALISEQGLALINEVQKQFKTNDFEESK